MTYECQAAPADPVPFSDALTAPDAATLLPSILAQTPRGPAWRTDEVADADHNSFQHRFWTVIGAALAPLYAKAWKLALASTACTLSGPEDPDNDSLGDWEAEFGLPEPCVAGRALTVDQRKFALRMKKADLGGQSAGYFVCLAAAWGYTIKVREKQILRCGLSRIDGTSEIGAAVGEVVWTVRLATQALGFFRCGTGGGRCGFDPLMSFGRAYELECLINTWKPGHTQVRFQYVYIGAARYDFVPGVTSSDPVMTL